MTVDEALVEAAQELGHMSLSATVNAALAAEVDRRARAAALGRLLKSWDESYGPVSAAAVRRAAAAFDDLDAIAAFEPAQAQVPPAARRRAAGRGAA